MYAESVHDTENIWLNVISVVGKLNIESKQRLEWMRKVRDAVQPDRQFQQNNYMDGSVHHNVSLFADTTFVGFDFHVALPFRFRFHYSPTEVKGMIMQTEFYDCSVLNFFI